MKLRQRAIPRFQAEGVGGINPSLGSSLNGASQTFGGLSLLIGLFLTFFGYRCFQVRAAHRDSPERTIDSVSFALLAPTPGPHLPDWLHSGLLGGTCGRCT